MEETQIPTNSVIWTPTERQKDFLSLPDEIYEALYGGAAGGGKDLSLDTFIPTPNGNILLKDIKPGDYVFSEFGKPILVLAESEIFVDHYCYKITFDNGQEVICGKDHLWNTLTASDREKNYKRTDEYRENRRLDRPSRGSQNRPKKGASGVISNQIIPSKKTTQEIFETQLVRNTRVNHSIPVCKDFWKIETKNLPIDPYVLGVWLGDGSKNDSRLAGIDWQIFYEIEQKGFTVSHHEKEASHNITGLITRLKELGLKNNKHIPEEYFRSSWKQRLEIIQGLMDTDGCCLEDGQCEFSNTNLNLAYGVYRLVSSFNIKPFISNKLNLAGNRQWYVKWTSDLKVFKLDRKNNRLNSDLRSTQKQYYINKVERVNTVPTKCIKVDNSTGLFLVSECGIPTHNSDALLMLPLVRKFIEHPRFKGLLLRRTFPELEKELIQRSLYWYKLAGGQYDSQKHKWKFPSGAVIQFGYCEHDNDVRQYDSAEYSYIGFDEVTSFTYWMYSYIAFTRCRAPGGTNLPAIVRSGTNPGNVGHQWVRERFIEPCSTGYKVIIRTNTVRGISRELRSIFIPSRVEDNPHLLASNPQYIANLSMLSEAEREAKLEGNWYTFKGQVFKNFRIWVKDSNGQKVQVYQDELSNARHGIDSFSVPSYWPRILAIDWGYSAMTCCGHYVINPIPNKQHPAKIYKIDEFTCKQTNISVWANEIKRRWQGINFVDRVIDPSAQQHRGDEFTIKQQVEQHFGQSFRLADNDRVAGKLLLQEYIRFEGRVLKPLPPNPIDWEYANEINRKLGPVAYIEYLDSFKEEKEELFLPKFQIFEDKCPETIKAIQACVYKKVTEEVDSEDVEDFVGDDPYDETRYGLKACQNYLEGGKVVAEVEQKREIIENELIESGNKYEYKYKVQKLNNVVEIPKAVTRHRLRRTGVR